MKFNSVVFGVMAVVVATIVWVARNQGPKVISLEPIAVRSSEAGSASGPVSGSALRVAPKPSSQTAVGEMAQPDAGSSTTKATVAESTIQELPVATKPRRAEPISTAPYLEQAAAQAKSSTVDRPSSSTLGRSSSNAVAAVDARVSKPASTPQWSRKITTRAAETIPSTVSDSTSTTSHLPLRREPNRVSVQAGAFKSLENAQKLTSRLLAAGIQTRTEQSTGFYRVIVGPYRDEGIARAAARGIAPLSH